MISALPRKICKKLHSLVHQESPKKYRLMVGVILAFIFFVLGVYTYKVGGIKSNFMLGKSLNSGDVLAASINKGQEKKEQKMTEGTAPSPSPTSAWAIIATPKPTSAITVSIPTVTPQPTVNQTASIRFGVVVNDYANHSGGVSSVESMLGKPISHLSFFKQFGGKNSYLIESDLAYAKSRNMKLIIAWEPWDPNQGMSQSTDYLKDIPTGRHDAYLQSFAQGVKNYGGPVIIRFGHEMNGNWYPWGNRPEEYKTAYRYIVNLFQAQGVSNVSWMWNINTDNVPYSPISTVANFYPGDNVVDFIGIDGYNFGTPWRSFTEIFSGSYNYLSSNYNKPLYIAETASSETGGNKSSWVEDMLKISLPNNFKRISEITWFNIIKETDWRIDSSVSSLQSFKYNLP